MVYRMIFNQTAYFGRGAIKEIPGVAKSHGFTKAFIVTDPVLLETGTVKKVTDVLDEAGMPYEVFDNVKPNPPVECIQDGVAKFAASGADFLTPAGPAIRRGLRREMYGGGLVHWSEVPIRISDADGEPQASRWHLPRRSSRPVRRQRHWHRSRRRHHRAFRLRA